MPAFPGAGHRQPSPTRGAWEGPASSLVACRPQAKRATAPVPTTASLRLREGRVTLPFETWLYSRGGQGGKRPRRPPETDTSDDLLMGSHLFEGMEKQTNHMPTEVVGAQEASEVESSSRLMSCCYTT